MIKFAVHNRFTGKTQFTAEINCAENEDKSIKLALAVKWAIENKADLRRTNLQGANLQGANLQRTDLERTNLEDANLRRANMWRANLEDANLEGANLEGANMWCANMWCANLEGANLRRANLEGANLQRTDLEGANLEGANLEGANLRRANLEGAKAAIFPVSFGPIGKEMRTGYAIWDSEKENVYVRLGCFYDTDKKAIEEVSNKYGARSGYTMMVKAACKVAKEHKVFNEKEDEK